jgi:uncharacterized membrane protein YgcG
MPSHRPAKRVTKSSSSDGKSTWKRVAVVMAILLLIVGGSAYAYMSRPDPALARIDSLRAQMDGADEAQRRELRSKMGEEFRNLSPESREVLRDQMEARWMEREQKHLAEFFALSPADQIKKIDEEIKEEERRRKEWEQRRAQRGKEGGERRARGEGGPGGGPGFTGGGGGGPGGERGGRGGGRTSNGDPNARSKRYLDRTPAPTRAMRAEKARMREERRRQLGYPPRTR